MTKQVIEYIEQQVKQTLEGAEGGHDWWHIHRVRNMALHLAKQENVNVEVVEIAALLHDIADAKFHDGDEELGAKLANEMLLNAGIDEDLREHVIQIIKHISFKGGNVDYNFSSPEFMVVQDADRLDAIGAIGIARTFNYGGYKNREMYNPAIEPNLNMSPEEYRKSTAPTINHFYEKLLLLKNRMNTPSGKAMAEARHKYMEEFLTQFYMEWDGVR